MPGPYKTGDIVGARHASPKSATKSITVGAGDDKKH